MCFPTLFSIAQDKGITNADYLSWRDSSVVRDITFMELLYSIRMKRNAEDKLYKRPTKSSLFEVKSFYRVLTNGGFQAFPWKSIWSVKILLKTAFFTWTVFMGRILTIDDLCHHKGIVSMGYASRIIDVLACWKGWFTRRGFGDAWCAVPLCLMWLIWKKCNCKAFEGSLHK